MPVRIRIFIVAAAAILSLQGIPAAAAPKAELWERWQAHDPKSKIRIVHAEWAEILHKYLRKNPDGVNRLAYEKVSPAVKSSLAGYIARLAASPVSRLSRNSHRWTVWPTPKNYRSRKRVT